MKQLLFILALLMGTCFVAHAQTTKLIPSALDSTRMDTVVVSDLQDVDEAAEENDYELNLFEENAINAGSTIAIVAIIVCCGLPFFIVAIVLWFRYKNKQAKYKLAAEALAAGRAIPKELFNAPEEQENAILVKGIKNTFLGIGLGVFLWMLTEEEGLAAIGFLIFCMGIGQVLIAYTTAPRKKGKDESFFSLPMDRDEKNEERQISKNNTDTNDK